MNARSARKVLLVLVLGLPVIVVLLGWVGGLLTAMEDISAANILGHLSTAFRVLWLLTVVGLVIALAVDSLDEPGEE